MTAWWASLGRGQRALVAVVGLVVAVNVSLAGLRSVAGSSPGGPASSSFGTTGRGLAAYADLLERAGHPVVQLRDRVGAADLPPSATAVVADPGVLTTAEARALVGFVERGGHLVVAGEAATPLLQAVTATPVEWRAGDRVDRLTVWLPVSATGSARSLAGDRGGRWSAVGPLVPVAGAGARPAVLVGTIGAGEVVALADSSLLQNDRLAQADNAAFALAAAGPTTRPVVFVESVHGFAGGGWSAVPSGWKWAALALAVFAAPVALWASGARFGPAEPDRRALRPPRLDHVEAVAADLERVSPRPSDLPEALASGAEAAHRQRLARGVLDPPARPADTVAPAPTSPGDRT